MEGNLQPLPSDLEVKQFFKIVCLIKIELKLAFYGYNLII